MLALLGAVAWAGGPAPVEEGPLEGRAVTVAQLEARCAADDLDACHRLGRRFHQGTFGAPVDAARAEAAYEKACRGGLHADCGYAAWYFVDAAPDAVRAAALSAIGCDGGDVASCFALGHLQLLGAGVDRNVDAGMARLRAGCDAGIPEACADLGLAHAGFVKDVAQDAVAATPLLRTACDDDGLLTTCGALGALALQGLAPGVTAEQGRAYTRKGCDAGDPFACEQLGAALSRGLGGPTDVAASVAPLRSACEAGRAPSCRGLSGMAMEGRGMAADRAQALAWGKRACELGDADLCAELDRACATGAADACR